MGVIVAGRKTTLTVQTATELEALWAMSGDDTISDQEICDRLGLTLGRLKGWLERNIRPIDGLGGRGPLGLRAIRAKSRAATKIGYLGRLNRVIKKAEEIGDLRTAAGSLQWLLERQFPKDFRGQQKVDIEMENKHGVLVVPGMMKEGEWELYDGEQPPN
jgi:hypothetical protein